MNNIGKTYRSSEKNFQGFGKILVILCLCLFLFSGCSHENQLVFCGSTENDLYQFLQEEGFTIKVVSSPEDAVSIASEGSAVVIVSDNYPETKVDINQETYSQAKEKQLKLYIEYPTAFPGISISDDIFHAILERGVVAGNAFEPNLESMSIVGINDCYTLEADVENPLLVLAKVAGFDKAEYGIDDVKSHPLLFQKDNCMVALTKLSNFRTGRYGPNDSWKVIWNYIISWLVSNPDFQFEKAWPADVSPMFEANTVLPDGAKERMIEKGTNWFYNGKFFIDSSWKERWLKYQANDANPVGPPIPQSFKNGNGSMGILEGHVSNILYNGLQNYRYNLRCDVHGETAYALAAAGKYLEVPMHLKVAENLINFVFNDTTNFRKKAHWDKKNPVYGLLGWGYNSSYVFYGDDNARCVLGMIGASSFLETNQWDRQIVENILANFRVSSINGFYSEKGSLRQAKIEELGWKYLGGREEIRHIQPHYESWIWACYLWLYDKTGYQPLLDKAKAAIRLTMEAYPDNWEWTNGIQQERARMILPLAWLVRVEDTEEHRKWLDMIVSRVLENQHECGAIQEELGAAELGRYGQTTSNSDYGTSEAPLIFENGDPVADMLYTTNFAFFALNEAAKATNNPIYKTAVSKMSDFLTRIQVKSTKHPDLDGAWFRAFDYGRWEYWASNADHGWGAWSTLTGWTQSWIVATQVLIEEDTSFWESTAELKVDEYMGETVGFMLE